MKWLVIIMSALAIGAVAAQLVQQYLIPSNGTIKTIGVSVTWLNGTEVTSLNWGAVENITVYIMNPINITNTENTNVTLTLSTINLSPSIISLTLTWNYTGAVLQPNQSAIVELEQTITATGDWNYTTAITATEAP